MINKNTFLRILAKSIINRKSRIITAAVAVLLGVSLVSALAAISLDARGKVGRELRAYGSNIVLSPKTTEITIGTGTTSFGAVRESDYLKESDLRILQSPELAPQLVGYAPYLYGVVEVNKQKVVSAGTMFDQVNKVSPWWKVTGSWVDGEEDKSALIGSNVAHKLGLDVGQNLTMKFADKQASFVVAGIVETGAAEDSQIFVSLPLAQTLFQKQGYVSTVQISALTANQPLSATAEHLQKAIPTARVAILNQVASAESSLVNRVEILLLLVSALVLLASALTVSSTMMTAILERAKEIGLMKALGASEAQVGSFFLAEAAAIGCLGGLLGFGIGSAIATIVGQSVFGTAIAISPLVLPLSLGTALAVSVLASIIPVRSAIRIDPAVTLRGE